MRKSKSKTGKMDEEDSVNDVERDSAEEASPNDENGLEETAKTDSLETGGDEETPEESTPPPKDPPKKRESRSKKAVVDKEDGSEEDEEYEVEKILDSKKVKGKTHFLIRWKGYQSESDTWEPENTVACPELITKFKQQNKQSNGKAVGKKRKSTTKAGSKSPKKAGKRGRPSARAASDDEDDDGDANESKEYEVEKIVEVHFKKNGKREFLIHWKGWSTRDDTWEPEEHLSCDDLIAKFMTRVNAKKNATPKDLRVAPKSTKRFTLSSKDSGRRLSKRRGNSQRIRYDDAE